MKKHILALIAITSLLSLTIVNAASTPEKVQKISRTKLGLSIVGSLACGWLTASLTRGIMDKHTQLSLRDFLSTLAYTMQSAVLTGILLRFILDDLKKQKPVATGNSNKHNILLAVGKIIAGLPSTVLAGFALRATFNTALQRQGAAAISCALFSAQSLFLCGLAFTSAYQDLSKKNNSENQRA